MWCGPLSPALIRAGFNPSTRPDLGFFWSGRRDSNPRPSPWQYDSFRPRGPTWSLGCASVHPVSVEFARELPCCRTVYYKLDPRPGLSDSVPVSEKTDSDPRPSRYQLNQFLGHPELTGSPGVSGSPLVWLHDPSIGECLKRNPSGSL